MRQLTIALSLCTLIGVLTASCGPSGQNPVPPEYPADPQPADPVAEDTNVPTSNVEQTTLAAVGLQPEAMNGKTDPCNDFYEYACGGWLATTKIPADRSRHGRFYEIFERNETELHRILEAARAKKGEESLMGKIGAYYGACMDSAAVEKAGTSAIDPLLKTIGQIRNRKSLNVVITELHRHAIFAPFSIASMPDFKDPTINILTLEQGGLGLPDRDYYLKKDKALEKIRNAYKEHLERTFVLAGRSKAKAKRASKDVFKLELELAKVSKTRVEMRDPKNIYNRLDRSGIEKLMPKFGWAVYFKALAHPDIKAINVESPKFHKGLEKLMSKTSSATWKSYLTYHVIRSTASTLPKRYVDEMFTLRQALSGAKEQRKRWKRCISATNGALGELLAQPYLETMFGGESKAAAESMVEAIGAAFEERVAKLEWMSDATKSKALEKRKKMAYLIGYPDKWKKYDFPVAPTSYAKNALASRTFELLRDLDKVGKPYDRSEWYMSPQTVNAYYNPLANQMVFPAGILQRPFFDAKSQLAVNYGAIGMIAGHELTHGFDDTGAKFDGDGKMADWWKKEDADKFKSKGECVINQYSKFEPVKDLKVNGKLTLGENIADIGGVKLSFMAYRNMRADAKKKLVADGLNEDQQFFVAVGQAWCSKAREEESRRRVLTDSHSPPRFRVNGALSNLPEFGEAFSCKPGTPMRPTNMCEVW